MHDLFCLLSWQLNHTAWRHQAITSRIVNQSSMKNSLEGIHLKTIAQEMLTIFIFDMTLKFTNFVLHQHPQGQWVKFILSHG